MFDIQESKEHDYYILTLVGNFTKDDIAKFDSTTGSILRKGFVNVIVNFRSLDTIPCSIIVPLLRLGQICRNTEGKVILVSVPNDFRFILYTAKISDVFFYKDSMDFVQLIAKDPAADALEFLRQKSKQIQK